MDEKGSYNNELYYTRFGLGGKTYEMNMTRFSKLLQLPIGGEAEFFPKNYSQSEFEKNITCDASPYVLRCSKVAYICNPFYMYLQCLIRDDVLNISNKQGVP